MNVKSLGSRSKAFWLIIVLIVLKFLTSLSYFVLLDFLSISSVTSVPLKSSIHSPPAGLFGSWSPSFQVLAFIQLCSGFIYVSLQRPLSGNEKQPVLNTFLCFRIVLHALVTIALSILWISALQLCGAFRTIFISSHYDFTVAGIASSFLLFKSGPKLRGAFLFGISWAILILYDDMTSETLTTSHKLGDGEERMLFSRNLVGLIILMTSLFLKFGFIAISQNLITDLGGSGRLHALSTLASGIILFTLLLLDLLLNADMIPIGSNLLSLLFITVFGFVFDYYIDTICLKKMESSRISRIGTTAIHFSALFISFAWASRTDVPTMASLIAFVLVYAGVLSLTSTEKASGGGSFVGYSSEGLPLFSFSNQYSETTGSWSWKNSIIHLLLLLKKILEDSSTRKLFYLVIINLTFCFVEFTFGYIGNSLALLSDGFFTFYDCIALMIGVHSIVICQCKPTSLFPFGFSRIEVLFGFVNTAVICAVSMGIVWEAVQRLFSHQVIDTRSTLFVAIVGLVLSVLIYGCRSSRFDHRQYILRNGFSVKGTYKQFLVETIGRITIVFSFLIIQIWPGLSFVDPICALFIVCLVIGNAYPLMKETSQILLLAVPQGLERGIQQALLQILSMEGVKGYKNHRFWTHSPEIFTGSMHIQVTHDAHEQLIIRQVNGIFCSLGFSHFTIQLEKDEFLARKNSEIQGDNDDGEVDTNRIKNDSICCTSYDQTELVAITSQQPLVL